MSLRARGGGGLVGCMRQQANGGAHACDCRRQRVPASMSRFFLLSSHTRFSLCVRYAHETIAIACAHANANEIRGALCKCV